MLEGSFRDKLKKLQILTKSNSSFKESFSKKYYQKQAENKLLSQNKLISMGSLDSLTISKKIMNPVTVRKIKKNPFSVSENNFRRKKVDLKDLLVGQQDEKIIGKFHN